MTTNTPDGTVIQPGTDLTIWVGVPVVFTRFLDGNRYDFEGEFTALHHFRDHPDRYQRHGDAYGSMTFTGTFARRHKTERSSLYVPYGSLIRRFGEN